MAQHNDFGKLGEEKAVAYLQQNGYVIQARNYRYRKAEIDIVAQKGNILAIVEVKSRQAPFLAELSDSINAKKKELLVMAADAFVITKDLDVEVRFDIITVVGKSEQFQLQHIKDAFYHF